MILELVFRHPDTPDLEIVWNGGATFNVIWCGDNTECFTVYGKDTDGGACTLDEAYDAARDHLQEVADEMAADMAETS